MNIKSKYKWGTMCLICILIGRISTPTLAWFKATITSQSYNLRTGDLDIIVNGGKNNFDISFLKNNIFPGQYLGTDDNNLVFDIKNNTEVPVVYTGGFKYNGSNNDKKILNAMIVEQLEREIYDRSNRLIKRDKLIQNRRFQGDLNYLNYAIDRYNIYGQYGRDNKISLREFEDWQNISLGNFKGYTMGMLKTGFREKWKYKVRFDSSALFFNFRNRNVSLNYKIHASQKNLDEFKRLSRDNVINVPGEVSEYYFNAMIQWKYTTYERVYFNIQR